MDSPEVEDQARLNERLRAVEEVIKLQRFLLSIFVVVTGITFGLTASVFMERGEPDYDHIAISLTIFQMLFGIAALYGFWSLRGLTRDKAEEVTKSELKAIASPIIARAVASTLEKLAKEGHIKNNQMEDMLSSLGGQEEDDG